MENRSQVTVNDELFSMHGRLRVSTLVAVKRHATQSFVLAHAISITMRSVLDFERMN